MAGPFRGRKKKKKKLLTQVHNRVPLQSSQLIMCQITAKHSAKKPKKTATAAPEAPGHNLLLGTKVLTVAADPTGKTLPNYCDKKKKCPDENTRKAIREKGGGGGGGRWGAVVSDNKLDNLLSPQ